MKKNNILRGLDENQKNELSAVLKLAKQSHFEPKHTRHVTHLALEIYEELHNLHRLDAHERYFLLCAALLHDIGVHTEGPYAHHKTSLNIILKSPILQFSQKDRLIVGSIARYHRRALPSSKHDHFKALNKDEQETVSILSSILRIADGLDYSHRRRIQRVRANFDNKKITFICYVRKFPVKKEIKSANKKSNLMSQVFKREIRFKTQQGEYFIGWS